MSSAWLSGLFFHCVHLGRGWQPGSESSVLQEAYQFTITGPTPSIEGGLKDLKPPLKVLAFDLRLKPPSDPKPLKPPLR